MLITFDDLRRFTVARNFFKPTTLKRALHKMGFVQADPIRAPARAQDLTLRHRVKNYLAGDLERRYSTLDIEEDTFVNYGFVTKSLKALMHPRLDYRGHPGEVGYPWTGAQEKQTQLLLEFVRQRGAVHPREVDEHFSHGKVTNYWGGSSNATTHLLDAMHYWGLIHIARREKGIRIYAEQPLEISGRSIAERRARLDALVDTVVRIYAPLSDPALSYYVRRLRYAVPQWREELTGALQRARRRLSHARIEPTLQRHDPHPITKRYANVDWYWPADEKPRNLAPPETVRFVAPFDPLVNDRARFEMLWGWPYRFEAYTPLTKRKLGYYALPLLWRDRVIGWGNFSLKNGALNSNVGYAAPPPRDRLFKRELELEVERMRTFLGL